MIRGIFAALAALLLCSTLAAAQNTGPYRPVPKAAFLWNGTAWAAATSSSTQNPLTYGPPQLPPVALYYWNPSTSQWVPATASLPATGGETISFSGGGNFISASATNFVSTGGYVGGGSQNAPFVAARAGTVNNCTVHLSSAQTATTYYTAALWKNGAACTSGPTMVFNSSTLTLTDSTHTCSVVTGDLLSWQFVPTNTPATGIVTASCLY